MEYCAALCENLHFFLRNTYYFIISFLGENRRFEVFVWIVDDRQEHVDQHKIDEEDKAQKVECSPNLEFDCQKVECYPNLEFDCQKVECSQNL